MGRNGGVGISMKYLQLDEKKEREGKLGVFKIKNSTNLQSKMPDDDEAARNERAPWRKAKLRPTTGLSRKWGAAKNAANRSG